MINLIKKWFFICLLIAFNTSVFATSSSNFLISQLAFKNYDYPATLLNFNADKIKLSQDQLLDKAIAAIITEDINLAKDIANKILEKNKNNQEAYIIKISSLFLFLIISAIADSVKSFILELFDPIEYNLLT